MYLCVVTLYHVHSSSSAVKKHPPSTSLFLLSQECHYSAGVVSLKKIEDNCCLPLEWTKTKYYLQDLLKKLYTYLSDDSLSVIEVLGEWRKGSL